MRLLAIPTMSPAVLVQVQSQSHNCPGQITIWAFRLTLQPSISPVVTFLVVFGQSSHKSCDVGCANFQLFLAFFLHSLKALESLYQTTKQVGQKKLSPSLKITPVLLLVVLTCNAICPRYNSAARWKR